MDRNLLLNLVRVTESAAIRTFKYLGKGDKEAADQAAVDGMHSMFAELDMSGKVVIGEGEMDEAPMLYIGEKVGRWQCGDCEIDIAVDPVDGTSLVADGRPNAIAVLAAAPKGCLLHAPDMYMEKIATGPEGVGVVSLDLTLEENIDRLAKAKNKDVSEIIVSVLKRPRHDKIVERIRKKGARIKFADEGDIATSISTCFKSSGIDLAVGTGGAPEGVITAAAIKALGGAFEARLSPSNNEEIERCHSMGIEEIDKILRIDDLVKGDEALFAATGVTDGDFIKGIKQYSDNKVKTYSIALRAETGTIRFVEAIHKLNKKPEYFLD